MRDGTVEHFPGDSHLAVDQALSAAAVESRGDEVVGAPEVRSHPDSRAIPHLEALVRDPGALVVLLGEVHEAVVGPDALGAVEDVGDAHSLQKPYVSRRRLVSDEEIRVDLVAVDAPTVQGISSACEPGLG